MPLRRARFGICLGLLVQLACGRHDGTERTLETSASRGVVLAVVGGSEVQVARREETGALENADGYFEVSMRLTNNLDAAVRYDVDIQTNLPHVYVEGLEDGGWTAVMSDLGKDGARIKAVDSSRIEIQERELKSGAALEFMAKIDRWRFNCHDQVRLCLDVKEVGTGSERIVASGPVIARAQ